MRQDQVMEAFDYCRRVTKRSSKTFYWGSVFLPQPKRQAVWAVYALCRIVDDIVDEEMNPDTPRIGHLTGTSTPKRELDYWRQSLERVYQRGGADDNLVQRAWTDVLERYPVPLAPVLDLLDGVEMDLTVNRYQSFEELYLYCYRVAGTVGLLTSPIFGYKEEIALQHAVDLGVALQLTNILRDVGEDARRNRIYLPQDEMQRFGYTESDLMSGVVNDAFCELLRYQMERANNYYQRSLPGISLLSPDSRLAIRLSGTLYKGILDRISLNNCDVFTKRASVPLKTKLAAASQFWFLQQYEMRVKDFRCI